MTTQSIRTFFARATTAIDFDELYHAELPRVYNFFRYRVGDNQVAEDLTSETFETRNRIRAS